MNSVLVFLGAGIGGVLRFWISTLFVFLFGNQFPIGTMFINISGSFFIGFGLILISHRFPDAAVSLRSLFLIGLLGGYTTFSAFSIETLSLFEVGNYIGAALNILLSVALGLLAVWLGMSLGKMVVQPI